MKYLTAFAGAFAGAAAAAAFAPWNYWLLMPAALAAFFLAVKKSGTRGGAALCGFAFGLAFFLLGLRWIYGALGGYIGLPAPAAFVIYIALCAALAAYPALAAAVSWRLGAFAMAGAWAVFEWLRGELFSGFPWLAAAYSQPPESPLYGWFPLSGISGANLMLALLAALAADFPRRKPGRIFAAFVLALVFAGGAQRIEWTREKGKLRVSLLQGNVAQRLKWGEGEVERAMNWYYEKAAESEGRWIIMPETALPVRRRDLPPEYADALRRLAKERNGAVVAGIFVEDGGGMYNAAAAFGGFPAADYRKRHLTPYGEYLPFAGVLRPLLLAADIPYNSLAAGGAAEAMDLPGGLAALSVCYEDIFGAEWRAQLPEAEVLINITNDGWFDGSAMLRQHMRMSRARAAEFGRNLARATNTGITAIVDRWGRTVAELEPGVAGVLEGEVSLRTGATPYARFGDIPALSLSVLCIFGAAFFCRREKRGAE